MGDANGNQSRSTRTLNGQTTSRTCTASANSDRLSDFTQIINNSSSTSFPHGYNTNGGMLTDGLCSYTYDVEGRPLGCGYIRRQPDYLLRAQRARTGSFQD